MERIVKKIKLLLFIVISIILVFPLKTEAFSGEVDINGYISTPMFISLHGKNNIVEYGTGKISISSSITNYSLYYQTIIISEDKENEIKNKSTETNQKVNEIIRDGTKSQDEKIAAAKEAYSEMYDVAPNYVENNWIQTTDGAVRVELSQYIGQVRFVLWAKLVTDSGTYYNFNVYSVEGTKEDNITLNKTTAEVEVGKTVQLTVTTTSGATVEWSSNNQQVATVNSAGLVTGVSKGTATITAQVGTKTATCVVAVKEKEQVSGGEPDEDGLTWTDFSNASITIETEDYGSPSQKNKIVVNGVTPIGADQNAINSRYQMYISTNPSDVPDLESDDMWTGTNSHGTDGTSKIKYLILPNKYQVGGDYLYVWIRERQYKGGWKYRMRS